MTEQKISEQTTLERGSGSNPSSPMAGEPAEAPREPRSALLTQCPTCWCWSVVKVKDSLVEANLRHGSKKASLKNWSCKGTVVEEYTNEYGHTRLRNTRCGKVYNMHSRNRNTIHAIANADSMNIVNDMYQLAEIANIQRWMSDDRYLRMMGLDAHQLHSIWNRIRGYPPSTLREPMIFRRWRDRRGGSQ